MLYHYLRFLKVHRDGRQDDLAKEVSVAEKRV
jgi:hypothetical protein